MEKPMTEQQANALMGWIEILTAPLLGEPEIYKDQLDGFTAMCRHRDWVMYKPLLRMCNTWDTVNALDDMQTWGTS
jgi:hypothetical protein